MTTRRTAKSDEFAAALEAGPGVTPKDPAVAAMVALAAGLAAIPQRPAPGFRDALRARLVSEAATVLPGGPGASGGASGTPGGSAGSGGAASTASPAAASGGGLTAAPWMTGPAMQLATGALATAVAVAGAGVAASRSVPGDLFYGLKRTVEDIRLGLAGDTVDEGVALLDQAGERLDEIGNLAGVDGLSAAATDRIETALRALDSEVRRAIERLLRAASAGNERAYSELKAELARLRADLVPLLAVLPNDLSDVARTILDRIDTASGRLDTLPVPPGVTSPSPSPTRSPSKSPSRSPLPSQVPTDLPTDVPTTTPPTSVPPVSPTPSTILPLPTVSVSVSLPTIGG